MTAPPSLNFLSGLWPPVATPFDADGNVDHPRLVGFVRQLLLEGARGVVLLGTTGEANSLSVRERHELIDAVAKKGVNGRSLIIGCGTSDAPDAADLMRHAAEVGAAAALLLPPFYFKPVSDDGLFAFVGDVIRRAGVTQPPILLYHFPALAGVGWSIPLISRIVAAFPGVVVGIKDSGSENAHTLALLKAFPGFAVMPGSESHLLAAIGAGARGFITTSGNVNARALADLIAHPDAEGADQRLVQANRVRVALKEHGLFPSVKAVIAAKLHDDAWLRLRPPLTPLPPEARAALLADPAIAGLLR